MDTYEHWFAVACSVAASLAGAGWFLRRFSQARHLLDTPTSKIRSAAQGYVEFYGVLQAHNDAQLLGPLTRTPCLWWHYKIEEYRSNGKERSWCVVESGTSEALLPLDDSKARCLSSIIWPSRVRRSRFILSCAGEDEWVRHLYWQAAGGVVLCVAGALATAWLLGIQRF